MAVVIDIDHETGDLTQYTSTVTDSGDLSVAAGAALAVTSYGLSCLLDDATAIYGIKSIASFVSQLRGRFYIDPNSLTMADSDSFEIFRWGQNGGSFSLIVAIYLIYTTATGYQLNIRAYNDAGGLYLNDTNNISDASHYVEFHVVKAATDVSSDGTAEWWIDGVSQGAASGADNYNRIGDYVTRCLIGAISNIDVSTSGTFYLDELIVNDDGSEIGQVVTGTTMPPKYYYYERRRN